MKRLKVLFAVCILILAMPFWRFLDLVVVISPFALPVIFGFTLWFGIFVAIPLKMLVPKIKTFLLVGLIVAFTALSIWVPGLSKMSTMDPTHNHCGALTFTHTFYPVRKILTDAYLDDLEARNQQCWLRKMISRVPEKFDMAQYSKIVHEKLLKPEIKFRSSLPLVAALFVKINYESGENYAIKNMYDSLHFWIDHYTEEISERKYPAWNWPHSNYIKFEYGLIEKNWQSFVDSIVIEG